MTKLECKNDLIDEIIEGWQNYDHHLDTSGTEIVGRIIRLQSLVARKVDENLAQHGLTVGEFDVLAALLRAQNYQLTPTKIQELMIVSSGGLSNRLLRLEKDGRIVRLPDPSDRRGVIVQLTATGHELIKTVIPTHLAIETGFIRDLNTKDKHQLQNLLKALLLTLER